MLVGALLCSLLVSQGPALRRVVVVTLDGVRPRELFDGAERALMRGVEEEAGLVEKYWRPDAPSRRKALFPFLWGELAPRGQVFGNAARGAPMTVGNAARVSYPGYAELFSGWVDPRIQGNDFADNPNVTLLEWVSRQPGFEGQVQVFAGWETFLRIFAVRRTGLDVRAGWAPPFRDDPSPTPTRAAIDTLFVTTTPLFGGNALDALVFTALAESLRTERPRLLVLALGEPDEWQHAGRYDLALESMRRADALLARLWSLLQSLPEYRGHTTLVVTTDHGRGAGAEDWRHHGRDIEGSEAVWLAAMGPGVEPLGERAHTGPVTSGQLASTVAAWLGLDWHAFEPRAAPPLPLSGPTPADTPGHALSPGPPAASTSPRASAVRETGALPAGAREGS